MRFRSTVWWCQLVLLMLGLHGYGWAAERIELTVSAASSLTEAFKEIAQRFETLSPGIKVRLNFGASGALVQQLAKGAPVDVLASADQETMDQAQKQALIVPKERYNFVGNTLVLVVPADTTLFLKSLSDLRQPKVKRIVLGNPASVPAGRYTQQALTSAKLWLALQPKMLMAQNVRQALDYVARGEVEAGFVYATDARLMQQKVKVALQVPLSRPIAYPIASVSDSAHRSEARHFIEFVRSPMGQTILAKYGFRRP